MPEERLNEEPGFYALIPATVRYNKNLCPNAKLLYGEITAMCKKKGFCWATNDYFAKLYKVNKTTISEWISQLRLNGHIYVEVVNTDSGYERKIYMLDALLPGKLIDPPSGNSEGPLREIPNTPSGNPEHIITKNNTNNIHTPKFTSSFDDVLKVYAVWEASGMRKHRKEVIEEYIKKKHIDLIYLHGIEECSKAVKNYKMVLDSPDHIFSYQWSFWDFIARGMEKFLDDADPWLNYAKDKDRIRNQKETEDYLNSQEFIDSCRR